MFWSWGKHSLAFEASNLQDGDTRNTPLDRFTLWFDGIFSARRNQSQEFGFFSSELLGVLTAWRFAQQSQASEEAVLREGDRRVFAASLALHPLGKQLFLTSNNGVFPEPLMRSRKRGLAAQTPHLFEVRIQLLRSPGNGWLVSPSPNSQFGRPADLARNETFEEVPEQG